jgi:hypothetical protein
MRSRNSALYHGLLAAFQNKRLTKPLAVAKNQSAYQAIAIVSSVVAWSPLNRSKQSLSYMTVFSAELLLRLQSQMCMKLPLRRLSKPSILQLVVRSNALGKSKPVVDAASLYDGLLDHHR